jgi:hypothetical protein
MPVLADIAVMPLAFVAGVSAIVVFLPVLIAETLVLWLLRWSSLSRSAIDALIMNIASTLVGAGLVYVVYELDTLLQTLLALLIAWVLSTLIEAVVLWFLRRQPFRRTWLVTGVANAASYLLLTAFVGLST